MTTSYYKGKHNKLVLRRCLHYIMATHNSRTRAKVSAIKELGVGIKP